MFARRVFIVALLGASLALPASRAAFQYPEAPTRTESLGGAGHHTDAERAGPSTLVAPTYVPKGVVNGSGDQ
jgi:hypothetical protein